jgi:hypothetical protein
MVATAIVLVCVLAPGGLRVRAEESDKVTRVYPLHYLDPFRAQLELEVAYPAATGAEMKPERTGDASYLRVLASPADQDAIARILAEKDTAPLPVTLQVILLEAMDAPGPAPELPEERKARSRRSRPSSRSRATASATRP